MLELQSVGVAVWGSCSVEELQCGAVAVWGSYGVGMSRCLGVAVFGSRGVGELQCGGLRCRGFAVCKGPRGYHTLDHCVLGVSLVFRVYREKLII